MTEVDQTTPRPPPRPLLVLIEFIIKIVMTYSHPIRRGIKKLCFFFGVWIGVNMAGGNIAGGNLLGNLIFIIKIVTMVTTYYYHHCPQDHEDGCHHDRHHVHHQDHDDGAALGRNEMTRLPSDCQHQ